MLLRQGKHIKLSVQGSILCSLFPIRQWEKDWEELLRRYKSIHSKPVATLSFPQPWEPYWQCLWHIFLCNNAKGNNKAYIIFHTLCHTSKILPVHVNMWPKKKTNYSTRHRISDITYIVLFNAYNNTVRQLHIRQLMLQIRKLRLRRIWHLGQGATVSEE